MKRIGPRECAYLHESLRYDFSNQRSAGFIAKLEKRFAQIVGVRYAIAMCNGTATLHTALAACEIGPGDEVIVPALTMMSTTFAVLHSGATPVFADIDPATWTLDARAVERLVTRKTKAVIPVALYGCPPDIHPLLRIARRHDLRVIEDNAQCVMGYYGRDIAGSLSDFASFSFQNSKHLSAGEGGILLTSDRHLAQKARRFAALGFAARQAESQTRTVDQRPMQDPRYARHLSMGWNYQIPDLVASIALAQVERMREFVELRRAIAALYADAHAGCSWLTPQALPAKSRSAYWTYALKLEDHAPVNWHRFRDAFQKQGGDGIYAAWLPNYLEPVLRGRRMGRQKFVKGLCPVTEAIQPKLLQFKTNYLDLADAKRQANCLAKTILALQKN